MKKYPLFFVGLLFCGCLIGRIYVCADSEPQTDEREQIHIQESVTDGVIVDADMDIYNQEVCSYVTQFKKFEVDRVTDLFWPDYDLSQMQIEEDETGGVSLTHQGENIAFNLGVLRYFKDTHAGYIPEILDYAKASGFSGEKDLEFMSLEDALTKAEDVLSALEIGGEYQLVSSFGLTADEMAGFFEKMRDDESYLWLFNSGKMEGYNFDQKDEVYCLEYSFLMDSIPVYGRDAPAFRISAGIDAPIPAYEMNVNMILSDSGVRYFSLIGALENEMDENQKSKVVTFDAIREALIKKYGDVIMTDEYLLSKIWLEYMPLIDVRTGTRIDLTPVWCCKFDIKFSGEESFEEVNFASRFHAFTGEEVS